MCKESRGLDLIQYRINVNGLAPGVVDTPLWDQVDRLFSRYEQRPLGEKKRLVGEAVPYGRMGRPDDYQGAAVFLACADSDYVVAQTLNVDSGNWMSYVFDAGKPTVVVRRFAKSTGKATKSGWPLNEHTARVDSVSTAPARALAHWPKRQTRATDGSERTRGT